MADLVEARDWSDLHAIGVEFVATRKAHHSTFAIYILLEAYNTFDLLSVIFSLCPSNGSALLPLRYGSMSGAIQRRGDSVCDS